MQNNYGTKIKYFRRRQNISQFSLEIDAGLASGMICRIEKGLTNPSKETLQKISRTLQLSPLETAFLYGIDLKAILREIQNKEETISIFLD